MFLCLSIFAIRFSSQQDYWDWGPLASTNQPNSTTTTQCHVLPHVWQWLQNSPAYITIGAGRPVQGSLCCLPGSPLTGLRGDMVRWCSRLVQLTLMWFPFVWPGPYFPRRLILHYSHHRPSAALICWQAVGGEASAHTHSLINTEKDGLVFTGREHTPSQCVCGRQAGGKTSVKNCYIIEGVVWSLLD